MIRYCYIESIVDRLLLAGDEDGLRYISFIKGKNRITPGVYWGEDRSFFSEPIRQLELYFQGRLKEFSLKLAPQGTPFQLDVLRALKEVPYGEEIHSPLLSPAIG